MTQTIAIFVDAYRELNARKLFWLSLGISFIIVAAFAAIVLTPNGLTFLWWKIESAVFNSNVFPPGFFYRKIFVDFGVKWWLAWLSTILALVSTAGMIPEFVASGSVELSLSKPIGRVRLFLTKYAAGLLFATMQVAVFSVGSYLVLGWRGGSWNPVVFVSIPLVVAFFSFLYCVCALLGLITRSTIASILLTLLVWFFVFSLTTIDRGIRVWEMMNNQKVYQLEKTVETLEKQQMSEWQVTPRREQLDKVRKTQRVIGYIHLGTNVVMTILPKTDETIGLLERLLLTEAEQLEDVRDDEGHFDDGEGGAMSMGDVHRQMIRERRERSVWWVLGTSLGFEAAVLGVACVIFSRRDF